MNRPIWHRIGTALCCLLFICCLGFRITVQAVFTEGVVIGGTMAATEAALGEATTVAIGSSGLTDPLRDAADEAGQSVQAFVNDRIAAYNHVASGSTLLPLMAVDLMRSLSYTSDGELIFSKEFANAFSGFMNWMIDNGDISIPVSGSGDAITGLPDGYNNSSISIEYPIQYAINSTTIVVSGSSRNFYATNNSQPVRIARFNVNGAYRVIQVSLSSFTANYYYYGNNMDVSASRAVVNGQTLYYDSVVGQAYNGPGDLSICNVTGTNVVLSDIAYILLFGTTSTGSTIGLDVWNDADDGVVIDPTALLGDAISGLQGAIANVGDYIATLADVIAGVQNPALPVVGVGDIPISIPADITIPINPAIPADRVDDVPATGEDTMPAYTGTGDYTLPLADFFPFCIPFDIYKMLSLLSAAPVAPSVDYPFPLPGGGTYTIHIDLSEFDSVAQVLRTIETLAFCVGLGFVTKKLLFGS